MDSDSDCPRKISYYDSFKKPYHERTLEDIGGSSKDFTVTKRDDGVIEYVAKGKLMDVEGMTWIASDEVTKANVVYHESEWLHVITTPPIVVTHDPKETQGLNYYQIMNKISKDPWRKLQAELRAAGWPCGEGRMIWHGEDEDPDQYLDEDERAKMGLGNKGDLVDVGTSQSQSQSHYAISKNRSVYYFKTVESNGIEKGTAGIDYGFKP